MSRLLWFLPVLGFAAILLAGCSPEAGRPPLAFLPPAAGSGPHIVTVPPNATPTPTPFQPLPAELSARFDWSNPAIWEEGSQRATPALSQPTTAAAAGEPAAVITPVALPSQGQPYSLPHQVHILLLGSDLRPQDVGFRTDTIILLTVDSAAGRATLLSFPRDLYVNIPGHGMDRINTAWGLGGFETLRDTLADNFGIRPEYYVLINFSSFKTIIDDLDGLDVQVAQPLSDYRYGYWTTIPAGEVHMDADTVLWYVRSRQTTNDFDRSRRQEEVLMALYRRLMSLDALKRAPLFFSTYRKGVDTNINFSDVLYWLPAAATIAQNQAIAFYHINYEHVYDWISPMGGMVLMPNPEAISLLIRQALNLQ